MHSKTNRNKEKTNIGVNKIEGLYNKEKVKPLVSEIFFNTKFTKFPF